MIKIPYEEIVLKINEKNPDERCGDRGAHRQKDEAIIGFDKQGKALRILLQTRWVLNY